METNQIAEDKRKFDQDYHDHHDTDVERLDRTLIATVKALTAAHIPYALIGGVAAKGLGRPRVTNDIDVFVFPDDAKRVLEVLTAEGFSTEERDPLWLFKAWREDVLVDIIFKSSGDIYFDDEMKSRVKLATYHGEQIATVSPEDLIVIKCAVHAENGPHHWHDALAVLKESQLDWNYLLKRARHAPRRLLALLIYGQSNDIVVPDEAIRRLYKSIYDNASLLADAPATTKSGPSWAEAKTKITPVSSGSGTAKPNVTRIGRKHKPADDNEIYIAGHIKEMLTKEAAAADQDIKIVVSGNSIIVRGEVFSEEQKFVIENLICSAVPDFQVENQLTVTVLSGPERSEEVLVP